MTRFCCRAPSEESRGIIGGIAFYGGLGVLSGALYSTASIGLHPLPPVAAKSLLVHHTSLLGAAAAVFGGTEGLLDTLNGGPSLTNQVVAGCASGSLMGN